METDVGGATVESLAADLPEPARGLMRAVRARLLQLGGVAEKVIFDYDADRQSPAFYVGPRQLCHAHVEGDRLEVTISLSRALTFEILRAPDVPPAVRAIVERTKEYGATRWVTVPIARPEDVEALLALARRKHRHLVEGVGELAMPRDQTTLEKFA